MKWLGACADIDDQRRLAEERETQGRRKMFFLNALSHDLRAPLNNVVLNAHLLKGTAKDRAEAESAGAIVEPGRGRRFGGRSGRCRPRRRRRR